MAGMPGASEPRGTAVLAPGRMWVDSRRSAQGRSVPQRAKQRGDGPRTVAGVWRYARRRGRVFDAS